jgi:hypothetical protein
MFAALLLAAPTLPGCTDLGERPVTPDGPANHTVTLVAVRDNTLLESSLGAASNGAGDNFFAGLNAHGERRRGLVAFDVAGSIPAGASIDSVALTLHLSRTNPGSGGTHTVSVHRVLADWGEGGSDAVGEEGGGAAAQNGDATWLHTFFDTDLWSNAGGDFTGTASASASVATFSATDALNLYSWSGPALTADVQSMLDDPSGDFGWAVLGNETEQFSAKRFDSKEDPVDANRPRLFVRYTLPAAAPFF